MVGSLIIFDVFSTSSREPSDTIYV